MVILVALILILIFICRGHDEHLCETRVWVTAHALWGCRRVDLIELKLLVAQQFFSPCICRIVLVINWETCSDATILFRVHTARLLILWLMVLVKASSRAALFSIITTYAVLALLLTLRTVDTSEALWISHLKMKGIGTVRLWASSTVLVREIFAKITAAVEISHRIALRTYIDGSWVRSYKFHSIFHDLESWLDCLATITA